MSLVITIIVMMIIAGVAFNSAINGDLLFAKANKTVEDWNKGEENENSLREALWNSTKKSDLASGLYYADTKELIMTWEELLTSTPPMLEDTNGTLSRSYFDIGSVIDKKGEAVR